MGLALKNLMHNAVKYSYKAGRNKRHISIRCLFEDNKISVEFENFGIGITQTEISEKKIWESNYRGYLSQDQNRCGAGLGLSHAKWAIEDVHDGEISCESNQIYGETYLTKFTVTFKLN